MGHRFRRLISAATFFRLAVSIILALVIWGFIVWETNPEITREFQSVPVTPTDMPANMLISGGIPPVSVTLKGPQDDMRGIVTSDITATIDLSEVAGPGIGQYNVHVDAPSSVRRVIVEPSSVEVELDLIVTRTFPVELREDEPRPASVTSIEASTEIASVQGPKALVDQVEAIELPVDLQSRRESFTEEVPLVPISASGSVVQDIEVSPATVTLSVTFESTVKNVPVIVVCACVVDERLEQRALTTAAAIPSTIRLSGPSSALTTITDIRTVPVDVSQLQESGWILDVEIDTSELPESVTISDQTVDVWVPVNPTRLELTDIPIESLGLGPGLEASLTEETVSVVVTGTNDALSEPDSLQVMAIVDLEELGVGTYTVEIEVVVPPEVSYEQVSPATVRVVIQPATTTTNRSSLREDPSGGIR
ncbi:MAG: CdaR family protein [Thermomicrobiales bacterium]